MRTLILVRHAKSRNDYMLDKNDEKRPLNDRGVQEANEMSALLVNKKMEVNAFVSSSALRALSTANIFFDNYKKSKMPESIFHNEIIVNGHLYMPSVRDFFQIVKAFDNSYHTVAVFSHNPGISEFAYQLTSQKIMDMPTCGMLGITANCDSWATFEKAGKELLFFDRPE